MSVIVAWIKTCVFVHVAHLSNRFRRVLDKSITVQTAVNYSLGELRPGLFINNLKLIQWHKQNMTTRLRPF